MSDYCLSCNLMGERIAALEAENAELREALEVVAQTTGHPEVYRLTRSALARKGGSKP